MKRVSIGKSGTNGRPHKVKHPHARLNGSLRYMGDDRPGIRRVRHGRGFSYQGRTGRPVTDATTLERIESLVIPPAWEDVWICTASNGHLQATGRDDRGRKQYLYHPAWSKLRAKAKYDRMLSFGALLPRVRRRVSHDLNLRGLPKNKVLALVVRLLEATLIRVGNEEYARANNSFGLTTLRDRHVSVRGSAMHFRFRGKSGKDREVDLTDRRLAKIVKRCRDVRGPDLFQYRDDANRPRAINSTDVNDYLREISGEEITAKDFRTWAATRLMAELLCKEGRARTPDEGQRKVGAAIRRVADSLGNTMAICKKSYIHPAIADAYHSGTLLRSELGRLIRNSAKRRSVHKAERALIALLEKANHSRTAHLR